MAVRFWEMYEEKKTKFKLRIVAGQAGMDTVVSWVHILEDESIIERFKGEELAVTTGMKVQEEEWLLHLAKTLREADGAGLIVNTGMYLQKIPAKLIDWCNENEFPLIEMPWEISITDLIPDFCERIMEQTQKDKRYGSMLKSMMRRKAVSEESLKEIEGRCNPEGTFRIFFLKVKVKPEDESAFAQAMLRLENVFGHWENGHKVKIPYFIVEMDNGYVLIVNDLPDASVEKLTNAICERFSYFQKKKKLFIGIGPEVKGIRNLHYAYGRARIALKMAVWTNTDRIEYSQMGFFQILFAVEDVEILEQYEAKKLQVLDDYDRKHQSNYAEILESYIRNDRSIQAVAGEMFIHRNTVNYRMKKIQELLQCELKTEEELFPYHVAFSIRRMRKPNVRQIENSAQKFQKI